MTDQTQAVTVAHRLAGLGCHRGAFLVLVNAAAQRQAAEVRDRQEWTPSGPIPLRRRAAENLNAANDHSNAPEKPSGTVA